MKLINLLPEENNNWFSAIFQIAESKINEVEMCIEDRKYVFSQFYGTTMLAVSHYYKPVII